MQEDQCIRNSKLGNDPVRHLDRDDDIVIDRDLCGIFTGCENLATLELFSGEWVNVRLSEAHYVFSRTGSEQE